jgi:hypothetical protein
LRALGRTRQLLRAVATAVLGWLADGTGKSMALLMLLFALSAVAAAWFRAPRTS